MSDDGTTPGEFEALVMSIATSGMLNLGQIPDPDTHKTAVNLPMAQHSIQMLSMLREKTRNNLNGREEALLERFLADLQTRYVALSKS